MSHKKITEELKEKTPRLASFKEHVKPIVMPNGFVDSMYSKTKPKSTTKKTFTIKYINSIYISGIAASIIYLVMYIYHGSIKEETLPADIVESYVGSHVDEYEEFITEESVFSEDWLTQELEDIPENQLISYLENNLDQIDLEHFIAAQ